MPVRLSVRPPVLPSEWKKLGFHVTDSHEIWYLSFFWKSVDKIQVSLKSDKNNGYFTRRPIYFLIMSCSILLRKSNVSDKHCGEKSKRTFYPQKLSVANRAVYEITCKNYVRRMRIACWRPKVAKTPRNM